VRGRLHADAHKQFDAHAAFTQQQPVAFDPPAYQTEHIHPPNCPTNQAPQCMPTTQLTPTMHANQILAKAEFLNPGGSVKDRVALEIVKEAVASGKLAVPGGLITEGTAGSTGIALAMVRRFGGMGAWMACRSQSIYKHTQPPPTTNRHQPTTHHPPT